MPPTCIQAIKIDGMEVESVPVYSETDTNDLFRRLESLQSSPSSSSPSPLVLPITKIESYPSPMSHQDESGVEFPRRVEAHELASAIVTSFFHAITTRHEDVVRDFVSRGLVSPDVTTLAGETPLLAAVRAGDGTTLRALVALGATVDGYGTVPSSSSSSLLSSPLPPQYGRRRTPLQLAAALGRLPLVKQLREEHGADDALIAADGELALRLAARNGHRDVVAYLPLRRGGAWKRWKTAHEAEMRRIRSVARGIVAVLRFVLWTVPRAVVWSFPKYVWEERHYVTKWCARQARAFPGRVKRVAKALPGASARLGRATWRAVKRVVKATPKVAKAVLSWIWDGIKAVGGAVAEVVKRIVAVLHTALVAVFEFFRTITLQDVINGCKAVGQAVFALFSRVVVGSVVWTGKVVYEVLKTLFGCAVMAVWLPVYFVWLLLTWPPRQIWKILEAAGRSEEDVAKGGRRVGQLIPFGIGRPPVRWE
ncbi:hypothetical protein SODALDRAFT_318766 [Sodiomyces alkalinus F11]|uniref:Uncharacterized protein n=1 Tax=Sodiomyces alkalinus (strain CBS 110278 / VKM F-3762 / F11) TaxID=1314773 RepID=A0A3N2Q5Q4_SODAK|nr:hypothetical protein SODALDRAFT_318766 [Sodiomyces alkalinus F11]ROT41988.1 hypothetical protein SODALDRAFT_318766 [Sodiomyces alkalinus F11]